MINKVNAYLLLIIAVALFHIILSKPLSSLDKNFTDLQFDVRGEVQTDSSIITLYVDNAIMDSLGRVPLKWIYYAKLIDELTELGVKAIGIDIVFDKNSPDYPGQASWLVTSIKNSGRVCIGGVFNTIDNPSKIDTVKKNDVLDSGIVTQSDNDSSKLYVGGELEVPFPWLLRNASGFGHLNFEENISIRKVPLVLNNMDSSYSFLKSGELIPAMGLELIRIYMGVPKDSLIVGSDLVSIKDGESSIDIPADGTQMMINYCGGLSSLNMISISEFLNMYRSYSQTRIISPELKKFKNKIVLIGLMGKRTSQFASTPYDNQFPLLGIHANVVDTILRNRFLSTMPIWITIMISMLFAGIIYFFTTKKNFRLSRFVLFGSIIVIAYLIISFILFKFDFIISAQPLIVAVLSIIFSGFYQVSILQVHSKSIEKEKHSIESMLDKSRQKISKLEETLTNYKNESSEEDSEFIREYRSELTNLSAKFDDLAECKSKHNPSEKFELFGIAYAKNSRMEEVIRFAKKIAPTDATVLINGESGTGKELIAKAIHNLSERRDNNFVTINCGAIPESLLESELFGHEEGAYTGAHKSRKGYFEIADKGTIFLDEITETNELFQTKLLRVLQSGELNRVGGTTTIKVNVRVIAATNKKIENLVKEKKFREDLYYRLNVIKIFIPPLRTRKNDIAVLAEYFLKKENASHLHISNSAMEAILAHNWPGNVRQLENVIKRASILAKVDENNLIQLKELPPEIIGTLKSNQDIEERIIETFRKKEFSYNSVSEVASELGGLHRSTIAEYLRGICFREFCEQEFDLETAAINIADSDNELIINRVQSKLNEYLNNLQSNIDKEIPLDQLKEKLGNKFKKLPNRYHPFLNQIIEQFYTNEFVISNQIPK
jgi:transcriptional regulator with GAF, ATPase, and Fis domain/CHASE2 domain-containing sensor protein